MASPAKKRRGGILNSYSKFVFTSAAKLRICVSEFLTKSVAVFMSLYSKKSNTSPELLMAAVLPTTAACMGPNGSLRMKPYGDYILPGNLFMIGVAEPGSGKTKAWELGSDVPLEKIGAEIGRNISVADCSKAALLKIQKENNGRGMIGADELFQFMMGMLKRSASDTSGERQLLLTLWGGRGHNVAYASKADIEIERSGLCIGGFTQPDRMMEMVDEMKSTSDGLFDRFLIWMQPGIIYTRSKITKADKQFQKDYMLKSLTPVFLEIFKAHAETVVQYRFSGDAQQFVDVVEDQVKLGIVETNSAMMFDDSSDEEEDEEANLEPIKSHVGSKYMDHLGRLSLSIHLFQSVLEQMLGPIGDQIKIPTDISLETVSNAKKLLDNILKQNEMILNALYPEAAEYQKENESEPVLQDSGYKAKVARKVLEEPGSLYPIVQLNRSRYGGEYISSSIVNATLEEMEEKGLGKIQKIKVNKTKPVGVFFKELPELANTESLLFYGVLQGFYAQQYFLPFSSSLKVDSRLVQEHYRIGEINEKRKPNLPVDSTARNSLSSKDFYMCSYVNYKMCLFWNFNH